MSFKDKKPTIIQEGYYYRASEMDEYLAIVEGKAEAFEAIKKIVKEFEYPNPFLRGDHNDWLNRLREILGAS